MDLLLNKVKQNKWRISFVIISLYSLTVRLRRITAPITNDLYHSFRTSETAVVIQDFFRNGFSFLHSSMPLFGKPWCLMFEFPLYQSIVFFVMKLFHGKYIDMWGRLVSIAIFYLCSIFVVKLINKIADEKAAYLTGILYVLSIYNIYWSRAVLIDYTSVLLAVIYVYLFLDVIKKPGVVNSVLCLISGALGYLTKATTMFVAVFFLFFLIIDAELKVLTRCGGDSIFTQSLKYIKENIKRLLVVGCVAIIPVLFGAVWTYYTDNLKALSNYTITLTSYRLHDWNFGTWSQKLNIFNWKVIWDRYLAFWGGKYALLAVATTYLFATKRKHIKLICFSFAAQFFTIFTLFNLYKVHNYYLIAITPFVYMCFGLMLYEIFGSLVEMEKGNVALVVLTSVLLLMGQRAENGDYISGISDISKENDNPGIFLNKITKDDELMLVADEDWNPSVLYDAERRGFMLSGMAWLDQEDFRSFIRDDNYTTVFTHTPETAELISESLGTIQQVPREGVKDSFYFRFNKGLYDVKYDSELIVDSDESFDLVDDDCRVSFEYHTESPEVIETYLLDSNGAWRFFSVTLLPTQNHMDVDFSFALDKICGIQMKLDEDSTIILKY